MTGPPDDRSSDRDRGLTLTEMLISIAIMGVVAITLSTAIATFLRTQADASDRVDRNRGLQQLVNHLPGDVASSQRIETAAPWTNPCLSIGTPVLNLLWAESFPGREPVNITVTYIRSSDGTQLTRNQCGTAATSSLVVARRLVGLRVEPPVPTDGRVDLVMEFDDGEHRLTATSRNR